MQCWPWVPVIAMSGSPTERGGVLGTVPERVKQRATDVPIAQRPASDRDFPAIEQRVLDAEGHLAYALTGGVPTRMAARAAPPPSGHSGMPLALAVLAVVTVWRRITRTSAFADSEY